MADAVLRKRCDLLHVGDVHRLILDSHEAQSDQIMSSINSASSDSATFSKTAKAAILVGAEQAGRACKVAFTYGLETEPEVAAKFLKKLTLHARHPHIAPHTSTIKPAKNHIFSKALTDAFSGMPKQSAAHRDGWTWELPSIPSTTALLQKIAEHFSNGALPKGLWTYLASALIYPFHKLLQEERISITDLSPCPITVGSVITRFGC